MVTCRALRASACGAFASGFPKKRRTRRLGLGGMHFLHYSFARIRKTLRVTPAMAAGPADHVWSMEEIIGLLDAAETKSGSSDRYGLAHIIGPKLIPSRANSPSKET
jgi:hypothetical protein